MATKVKIGEIGLLTYILRPRHSKTEWNIAIPILKGSLEMICLRSVKIW